MNELQRIAKGNGTRFENWVFAVLFLIVTATWVHAADYTASQKIDGLADVSASLTTSARVPVQDMGDTDKLGYVTVLQLLAKEGQHDESADTAALTAAEMDNKIITNIGWDGADDQTFGLAAGEEGMDFTVIVHDPETDTANVIINPDDADIIVLDGTPLDAGDSIAITDPTRGSAIHLSFVNDGGTIYIYANSINGIWADNG